MSFRQLEFLRVVNGNPRSVLSVGHRAEQILSKNFASKVFKQERNYRRDGEVQSLKDIYNEKSGRDILHQNERVTD